MLPLSPARIAHKPLVMSFLSVPILFFARTFFIFSVFIDKTLERKCLTEMEVFTIEIARGNCCVCIIKNIKYFEKLEKNDLQLYARLQSQNEWYFHTKGVNSYPLSHKKWPD